MDLELDTRDFEDTAGPETSYEVIMFDFFKEQGFEEVESDKQITHNESMGNDEKDFNKIDHRD